MPGLLSRTVSWWSQSWLVPWLPWSSLPAVVVLAAVVFPTVMLPAVVLAAVIVVGVVAGGIVGTVAGLSDTHSPEGQCGRSGGKGGEACESVLSHEVGPFD